MPGGPIQLKAADSIVQGSGCLTKELSASGFTRKDYKGITQEEPEGNELGTEDKIVEEDQSAEENDENLVKSLNKQRTHAISAACRGHKNIATKNSYKDKGRRSLNNSKIQEQFCSW